MDPLISELRACPEDRISSFSSSSRVKNRARFLRAVRRAIDSGRFPDEHLKRLVRDMIEGRSRKVRGS